MFSYKLINKLNCKIKISIFLTNHRVYKCVAIKYLRKLYQNVLSNKNNNV